MEREAIMSFDGLFTRMMTKELAEALAGGRIGKIYQPSKNEVLLIVRSKGKNVKLLLSAHPVYARIQLTEEEYVHPKEPPMFCMVLRKHLEGAVIEKIEQRGLDRVVLIHIKGRNEIGDPVRKQLIIELMGKHSNIVLTDGESGTIIDSIKHVSHAVNRYRAVLPGQSYRFPPEQDKTDPLACSETDIVSQIDFNAGKIDAQLVSRFLGISPLFAKEVVHLAGLPNRETVPKAFLSLTDKIKRGDIRPALMKREDKEFFYLFPLEHVGGERVYFKTLSELLDRYYFEKAERDRVKQIAGDLERFIKKEFEKNERKREKLQREWKESEKSGEYQLYGELLTANLHLAEKGMKEITVTNYYTGKPLTIPLDADKSPSENAQAYFRKYQKAKNAREAVKTQLEQTEKELEYLSLLHEQIRMASAKDLDEIKEELAEQGYLKEKAGRKEKPGKKAAPAPEQFLASDGTPILVGKNNKQNEYLTMRLARKEEVWLHAKNVPGSHVVIRSSEPSEETLLEAAHLAAYYSKARNSGNVDVDYTKVKYVRKPTGAKPGFVIYDHQKTVRVTPDTDLVAKMRKASRTHG
jgi:predicted ribosome quality control (RQC) complex YloA/Tae2 family protein